MVERPMSAGRSRSVGQLQHGGGAKKETTMALEVPERPDAIREGPVAAPASESARRLDRLAPLIHELVAWDLVYRTDAGEFVLHDDVQHRLAELTALRHQPAAQLYI